MKTEDYNRLKEICEREGFEVLTESPFDNDKFYVVKKKPERVKVEFTHSEGISRKNEVGKNYGSNYRFDFEIVNNEHKNLHHIGNFLASKLEEYLNQEK
jgi:hypothetical protein